MMPFQIAFSDSVKCTDGDRDLFTYKWYLDY